MLKFKGKPCELEAFIQFLKEEYGEEITLKELINKIKGDIKNVNMSTL